MARHTHMQRFQAKIQDERTLRRLHSTEITHQLRRCLGNKRAFLAKLFGVGNTVIRFIRCAQTGELVGMRQPVELATVDNSTAQASSMTIHILRSRMRYDVCTPFQRAAVNRCREGVIHDQRHTMTMRSVGKFFNIQHRQCGVSDNFAKHSLGVILKSSIQLFVRSIWRNKGRCYAHLRQRYVNQIIAAAVNRRRSNNMAARLADVEQGKEVRCLSGRSEHCRSTALQLRNLSCYEIAGRVLQAGVKIACSLQVEQLAHCLASIILKGC